MPGLKTSYEYKYVSPANWFRTLPQGFTEESAAVLADPAAFIAANGGDVDLTGSYKGYGNEIFVTCFPIDNGAFNGHGYTIELYGCFTAGVTSPAAPDAGNGKEGDYYVLVGTKARGGTGAYIHRFDNLLAGKYIIGFTGVTLTTGDLGIIENHTGTLD